MTDDERLKTQMSMLLTEYWNFEDLAEWYAKVLNEDGINIDIWNDICKRVKSINTLHEEIMKTNSNLRMKGKDHE